MQRSEIDLDGDPGCIDGAAVPQPRCVSLKIVRLGGGGRPPGSGGGGKGPPSAEGAAFGERAGDGNTGDAFAAPALSGILAGKSDVPSLTGPLGGGTGARLLMELFAGERTGRLVVEAAPAPVGTIYFFSGEPVHVGIRDGGASIERRIAARMPLKAKAEVRPAPKKARSPLGVLARRADPIAVLDALREEVREHTLSLLTAKMGQFAFYDGEAFLDATPLTAVNSFALVLDARRRALDAQSMFRIAEQVAPLHPAPRGAFANATARLRPFTNGVDLAEHVDGTRSAAQICAACSLEPVFGGLLLSTLVETGLLEMHALPRGTGELAKRKQKANAALPTLVQADSKQLSQLAAVPGRGGAEVLALYLEIKPEDDADVILGIEGSAGPSAVERAYQQRLAELDPRAINPGPNRPYLLSRVEELRAKVERAYGARMPQRSRGAAAYEILDRIGVGGMAEVFRGRATDDPDTLVAIKVILPDLKKDQSFAEMFLEEARLARRIQHPNVVRVLTVGKGIEDLYLAMEYVDGCDFAELIKRAREENRPASIDIVMRVVAEACAGLHAAHTALDALGNRTPILHRDVSTQNILVSRMGDVKLSDFGIAKAHDTHEDESNRSVKGKIPYLAPELLRGDRASVLSDVYAMAMTVYAAVAKLPFARGESTPTMHAILKDPLPALSSMAPLAGVPRALDELLLRAAARNPAERHASAQEMQLELEDILAQRAPVDLAAWARPLARRGGAAGTGLTPRSSPRPITSSSPRSITSTTSRPITSSIARPITSTQSRPFTSAEGRALTSGDTGKNPAAPRLPPEELAQPPRPLPVGLDSSKNPAAPGPVEAPPASSPAQTAAPAPVKPAPAPLWLPPLPSPGEPDPQDVVEELDEDW